MLLASESARFWAKVDKTEACWVWTSHISIGGYGRFMLRGRAVSAHRVSFELANGSVPAGKDIDHLCNNKRCVNPAHLEAVSHKVNGERYSERRTHCKQGHELTNENTYTWRGRRLCLVCKRGSSRDYMRRVRQGGK